LSLPEPEVDFSLEVSFFSLNFSIFGRYFGKKLREFDLNFSKMTNFLGISTGSSFVSAGSKLIF
jgi:hypothetical protein